MRMINKKSGRKYGREDSSGNVSMNTQIVNILEDYDKEIPMGFLARKLFRSTPEIQRYVEKLEEKEIVVVHNNNISINRAALLLR
jgi:hypothetical protein